MMDEELQEMIDEADRDGDGEVNLEEFTRCAAVLAHMRCSVSAAFWQIHKWSPALGTAACMSQQVLQNTGMLLMVIHDDCSCAMLQDHEEDELILRACHSWLVTKPCMHRQLQTNVQQSFLLAYYINAMQHTAIPP